MMLNKLFLMAASLLIFTILPTMGGGMSSEDPLEGYFKYRKTHPSLFSPMGDASKGEIEIILDPTKIAEIEKETGRKVGLVLNDKFWVQLNDAVKFPSGKYGVYSRVLWRSSLDDNRGGAVVMAVLPNGKIVLNRNFRHATRSWEYELPRGARNPKETLEGAARREAKEETGMVVQNLSLLGEIAEDTGTLNSIAPIFYAKVVRQEETEQEDSEAIASVDAFSVAELKKGFLNGYLEKEVDGQKQQIPLRDPFLAYALFMAELKHLI